MNARVLRTLGLAAAFAVSAFASFPAAGQTCECTHQGASVDCPANLPPGSRSVQFVPGGTTWVTPSGQSVFVPHTSFGCTSRVTAPSVQHSKTSSAQTLVEPQSDNRKGTRDRSHGFDLIGQLGREIEKKPHSSSRATSPDCNSISCASHLKEDPGLMCYRHVRATLSDSDGVPHHESLYDQLVQASGIGHAQLQPMGKKAASINDPAYDCAGTFYDRNGNSGRVPPFPPGARSDADVQHWIDSVMQFYRDAFLDHRGNQLSPGKASLCTEWAGIYFQSRPDPSVLQAFDTLQHIGAEKMVAQDTPWLTRIVDAGTSQACPVPPLSPQHGMDSWAVPESSARPFLNDFRNCEEPDTNRVGGCPHAFDGGNGNHVNAQHLFDATTTRGVAASFFVGDEPPACGADCYRQTGEQRSPSTPTARDAESGCMATVGACIQECGASNAVISKQCIDSGGSPSGGMCSTNVDRCSCTQTAPDCRKVPSASQPARK